MSSLATIYVMTFTSALKIMEVLDPNCKDGAALNICSTNRLEEILNILDAVQISFVVKIAFLLVSVTADL